MNCLKYEMILVGVGLFYVPSQHQEEMLVCVTHIIDHNFGRIWRPLRTFQYLFHHEEGKRKS